MGFDKKISRNLKNVLIKTGILGPQNSLIGIQSQTYPFFGKFWILYGYQTWALIKFWDHRMDNGETPIGLDGMAMAFNSIQ